MNVHVQVTTGAPLTNEPADLEGKLRHVRTQARSRQRLRRVLDAAD